MQRNILLILVASGLFLSCGGSEEVPEDLQPAVLYACWFRLSLVTAEPMPVVGEFCFDQDCVSGELDGFKPIPTTMPNLDAPQGLVPPRGECRQSQTVKRLLQVCAGAKEVGATDGPVHVLGSISFYPEHKNELLDQDKPMTLEVRTLEGTLLEENSAIVGPEECIAGPND